MISRRRQSGHARGFSLIELMLTLAVSAILLAGLSSTILFVSHAVTPVRSDDEVQMREVLRKMLQDVRSALDVPERGPHVFTAVVPDRNADGSPDTVRYAWSGTLGDPLTYEYNGSDPVDLLANVRQLDLGYVIETRGPPPPPPTVESPEQELIAHDDAPGGDFRTYALTQAKWGAQYIDPVKPSGTVAWSITRLLFRARKTQDVAATLTIEVRDADAEMKPGTQVLEAVDVPFDALDTAMLWHEVAFATLVDLDPDKTYCFVFRTDLSTQQCEIEYENNGSPMTASTHWCNTGTAGANWSNPSASKDLRFFAYGTYTTVDP